MKSRFLFSHNLKGIGWALFGLGVVFGMIAWITEYDFDENFQIKVFALVDEGFMSSESYFKVIENGIVDELICVLILVGGILVGFSKAKEEDEFISRIRSESLIWATYVNYAVLLFSVVFVYGITFFNILIYNMFTSLIFFILRFHYVLYKSKKNLSYEE